MARIVIEIDGQLKRNMKAKLAQDGKTFKDVLTEFCRWYVAGKIEFSHWSDQCINLVERFENEQT